MVGILTTAPLADAMTRLYESAKYRPEIAGVPLGIFVSSMLNRTGPLSDRFQVRSINSGPEIGMLVLEERVGENWARAERPVDYLNGLSADQRSPALVTHRGTLYN